MYYKHDDVLAMTVRCLHIMEKPLAFQYVCQHGDRSNNTSQVDGFFLIMCFEKSVFFSKLEINKINLFFLKLIDATGFFPIATRFVMWKDQNYNFQKWTDYFLWLLFTIAKCLREQQANG